MAWLASHPPVQLSPWRLIRLDWKTVSDSVALRIPSPLGRHLIGRGIELAGFLPLDDHQPYTNAVIARLVANAQQSGARILITTEKDLVKLVAQASGLPMPFYGLRMQVDAEEYFVQEILGGIRSLSKQA